MKKVQTTVDAFEPALGASFMMAHIVAVLTIYHSSGWDWDLLLSIPLLWVIAFFLSLFITYPIYLALTPLYLRLSSKKSFMLFLIFGLLFLPSLAHIADRIPKLAISEQSGAYHGLEGIMILSVMGACISTAAWYRARKYEKRTMEHDLI
jgi:phosphate/sulfate permease